MPYKFKALQLVNFDRESKSRGKNFFLAGAGGGGGGGGGRGRLLGYRRYEHENMTRIAIFFINDTLSRLLLQNHIIS